MPVTIDKFEYATDAAARAAWGRYLPKLWLKFAGSGNSFVDSSPEAHTLTPHGDVTQSGGYGVFDGTGDYVNTDTHADFGLGTGDFTVEFIAKCPVSQNAANNLFSNGAWAANKFALCTNHFETGCANKVTFWCYNYGTGGPMIVSTSSVNTNEDVHICLERYGNNFNLYIAGTKEKTRSSDKSVDGGGNQVFNIGGNSSNEWFKGSVKAFRFTKAALYKGINYTPSDLGAIVAVSTESTIKKEGSYSMKIVAPITISLNKTAIRTVSPTINLTDQDSIKIWVRASRTGTNFKIGLHDSGGTTTESNIAISSADTWEEKTIDISAVANANKDAIDLITITVTNADAENTIYLDEMLGYVTGEGTGGGSPRYGDRTGGK